MGEFLHRDCPLCGAPPPPEPEVFSSLRAESLSFEALIPHWNAFFEERVFFSYYRCPNCGLLYAPHFFSEEQLSSLYAQMAPNMDLVPTMALRKTQRGYFNTLKARSSLEGDYIEIGPDTGLFVENCVIEGSFNKYWLYEPNREVANTLRGALKGAPHAIVHEMSNFSAVPRAESGAVVMVHVLDHLLDPLTTLRELRSKLREGGVIAIVTHNESSILRRLFGARWVPFCLQHPQVYNPRSMKSLLEVAGFDDIQISRTVNYFPVQFLLKHLFWALGIKVETTPSFGGWHIGLKLGNIITTARNSGMSVSSS